MDESNGYGDIGGCLAEYFGGWTHSSSVWGFGEVHMGGLGVSQGCPWTPVGAIGAGDRLLRDTRSMHLGMSSPAAAQAQNIVSMDRWIELGP